MGRGEQMNPPNRYKVALEGLCGKCRYHDDCVHMELGFRCVPFELLSELIPELPKRKDEEQC